MEGRRSFTVESLCAPGKKRKSARKGGRFLAASPAAAARKAVNKACQGRKKGGQCSYNIVMRETTQGGTGKEMKYKVRRVKDPVTVERDGEEITFNYRTVVKSCQVVRSKKSKKSKKSSRR